MQDLAVFETVSLQMTCTHLKISVLETAAVTTIDVRQQEARIHAGFVEIPHHDILPTVRGQDCVIGLRLGERKTLDDFEMTQVSIHCRDMEEAIRMSDWISSRLHAFSVHAEIKDVRLETD